MKTRTLLLTALLLLSGAAAMAAVDVRDDKPINVNQLPAAAKQFIVTHFRDVKVSFAKMDDDFFDKTYDVIFVNGNKVEFDKNGDWKDVDCDHGRVPDGIVPVQIVNFINKNHGNTYYVTNIDRDRKGYDVKLSNGLELKFDTRFNIIGYDD